ncbi:MAG TPA: carbohydrate ABC transporter permease [Halanaerobiales bacterium]|nr:carbohydrate ABC transporter permease [Halanaerobiales bacterium]
MNRKLLYMKKNKLEIFSYLLMTLISAAIIIPFVLLFSSSFTDELSIIRYGYNFIPREFSLDAYRYLWANINMIARGYGLTILVTVVGVGLSLLTSSMLAYPLSRKDLPGRGILLFLVLFTMLFHGGLVPSYLVWTRIFGIKNTIYAYIFPGLMLNGYYVFLMRSYFINSIPKSLLESAKIDGAGEFQIYYKIVLPLSLPIMATIGLMVGLLYWNNWTNGLYYITDPSLYTIQVILQNIIKDIQFLSSSAFAGKITGTVPGATVRMAIATIATIPILVIYPFFQKYFVKGITIGAVKG